VVVGKIMILRTVLRKISCRATRKKQRGLRNHGNSKTGKAESQKKDLKENENNSGQMALLDIYYIWIDKMRENKIKEGDKVRTVYGDIEEVFIIEESRIVTRESFRKLSWYHPTKVFKIKKMKISDPECGGCSQNYQDECRIFQIPRTRKEAEQRGLKDPNCMEPK